MVLIPLSTFYFFFHIIFKSDPSYLGWSGIAAVFAVNMVIVSYVIMAWNEDIPKDGMKRSIDVKAKENRVD